MSSGSFCSNCGSQTIGAFCGTCGARQVGAEPTSPGAGATPQVGQPSSPVGSGSPAPHAGPGRETETPVRPVSTMTFAPIDFDGDHPRIGSLFLAGWQSLIGNAGDWFQTIAVAAGVLIGIALIAGLGATSKEPIVLILLLLIGMFAWYYVFYGFARTALSIARGRRPTTREIWRPERLLPFVAFIIIANCLLLGSLPTIIGPVVIGASIVYAPFFILEDRGSGMTGLWQSVRASTTNSRLIWQILLIIFAVSVVFASGGAFYLMLGIVGLATAGSGSTGVGAVGLIIAGLAGLAVLIGSLIISLSAAATAYVHLDSGHLAPTPD